MSEKEQPANSIREEGGWDRLNNRSYTAEGWRKMMEERRAEFQEAVGRNDYEHAQRLILVGNLNKEMQPEEIADFAGRYFDYHMSESKRLRDPQEFREFVDEAYGGSPAIDQALTVQRHLENAVAVKHLFGEHVSQDSKKELDRLAGEAAKPLFELLIQYNKFFEVLNSEETGRLLEDLDPEERRNIATEGIRQALAADPLLKLGKKLNERTRRILAEWAAKYGVEDEDILEALTAPDKEKPA